jgi:hypothetical protein
VEGKVRWLDLKPRGPRFISGRLGFPNPLALSSLYILCFGEGAFSHLLRQGYHGTGQHLKRAKAAMNSIYHLNENKNAEAKHRTNSATAGEAGLLRDVSARWTGAKASAAAPKQRDACVPRNDGGSDRARRTGEGEQPRHQPPTAPTV